METSEDLLCQCYYNVGYQRFENGAKLENSNANVFIRNISGIMSND